MLVNGSVRRVELEGGWQHALATNLLVEHVTVSLKTIDYAFSPYFYPDTDKKDLFSGTDSHHKTQNINAGLLTALARTTQIQAEIARLYPQVEKGTLVVELPPKA